MGSQPNRPSTAPIYAYSYRFTPTGNSQWAAVGPVRIEFTTTESDPSQTRAEAFSRLATTTGVTNPDTEFRIENCRLSYDNPPWGDDYDELERTLQSIPGVSSVRYEDPYDGDYRAPRYHLTVDAGEAATVAEQIHRYYGGLHVRTKGSRVEVVISVRPPQNW